MSEPLHDGVLKLPAQRANRRAGAEFLGVNEKPNLLVIVTDTLRRDHLGSYGNGWIRTPHLDAFGQTAVVFDHYRAGSFPTMPARADLLTGKLSFSFMRWEPLPRPLPTLPALVTAAGYSTTAVVDTPFFGRSGFGYDRGFQDFIWIRGQGDSPNSSERTDVRATWRTESDRFVARTVTAAEEWLERHHRERFFLYVDTWDPHEPWDAPDWYTQFYFPEFDGREVGPPYGKWRDAGMTAKDVEVAHATYCGEVTMVDRWLGRLLEKVELLGLAEKTVIVLLSDHGFYFGEHGYLGKAVWDFELRRQIWSPLYSELTRVPLMIRVPGGIPGRRDALATAADVPATLLELAGCAQPPGMQGRSLLPLVTGEAADELRKFVITSWPLGYQRGAISNAVDSLAREVVRYLPITISTRELTLLLGGPQDPAELYDLTTDPMEETNVWVEKEAEGLALMSAALDYLEQLGTAEDLLAPRRELLDTLRAASVQ